MKTACTLCFHKCRIEEGKTGFCRARTNKDGVITNINYGRLTSLALDPVEKKPLKQFHPGTFILSAGSFGCNLACPFCQNSEISMADATIETAYVPPEMLAAKAVELSKKAPGNIGIAYTYNEPLISFEYVLDTAKLIRNAGLLNVLVTNGTINEAPLKELLPFIDAMNIDLKGFTQDYYSSLSGDLETVKRTIELSAKACHVELTTLIVPARNDSCTDMENEAKWIASVSKDIPLHITRFFPHWKAASLQATPIETIRTLCSIAEKHLPYVYSGNC